MPWFLFLHSTLLWKHISALDMRSQDRDTPMLVF
uniref:Uncharacterized protein n=1 Tax=Populus trichocarpa TaxID=3694 RepID=A9PBW8_POPTR|nr:unknown [Populus trichocarpa]